MVRETGHHDTGRMGNLLLLGDAVAAHALAGIAQLGQQVAGDDIASADDARRDGDRAAVAIEPPFCRGEHCGSGVE